MIDRPRMARTLVLLVIAMTGTTAFLGWIDPAPSNLPTPLALDDILRGHYQLLSDLDGHRAEPWQEVQLQVDAQISTSGMLLVGTANSDEWHFRIDPTGRATVSRRWREQVPVLDAPASIRIIVARAGLSEPISPVQWVSIRALVGMLSERLNSGATGLPVRLEHELSQRYGLEPDRAVQFAPLPASQP